MTTQPPHWLVNGRDRQANAIDIEIGDGTISRIIPAGSQAIPPAATVNLGGRLVLPGLIDGHLHLDKTFLGLPWKRHAAGPTVLERIENEIRLQSTIDEPVRNRSARLLDLCLTKGTVALRTHVDIDVPKGLGHLHEVLEVRALYRDLVDIQIVAFPQSGVLRQPGVADLLDHAVAEGADLVGGLDPATIDKDIDGQLDTVFGIAQRRGVGVDLHLHNTGEVGMAELDGIIERTRASGLHGRVTLSHAYCLGSIERDMARRTADRLAEAGIDVMSACPGAVPMPPLDILKEARVRVFFGNDNVRDAWSPFGNADLLERLMLLCYRAGYRRDEEIEGTLEYVTVAAASALGLPDPSLVRGSRADLIAVDARCSAEAIAARPVGRMVFKSGRLVACDGRLVG